MCLKQVKTIVGISALLLLAAPQIAFGGCQGGGCGSGGDTALKNGEVVTAAYARAQRQLEGQATIFDPLDLPAVQNFLMPKMRELDEKVPMGAERILREFKNLTWWHTDRPFKPVNDVKLFFDDGEWNNGRQIDGNVAVNRPWLTSSGYYAQAHHFLHELILKMAGKEELEATDAINQLADDILASAPAEKLVKDFQSLFLNFSPRTPEYSSFFEKVKTMIPSNAVCIKDTNTAYEESYFYLKPFTATAAEAQKLLGFMLDPASKDPTAIKYKMRVGTMFMVGQTLEGEKVSRIPGYNSVFGLVCNSQNSDAKCTWHPRLDFYSSSVTEGGTLRNSQDGEIECQTFLSLAKNGLNSSKDSLSEYVRKAKPQEEIIPSVSTLAAKIYPGDSPIQDRASNKAKAAPAEDLDL